MRDYAVVSSNGLVLALAGQFVFLIYFGFDFYGFDGFDGFYGPSRRIYCFLLVFMLDLNHIHILKYLATTPLGGEYI